jgi:nucleotide-binding universal stress UspA family protein
MFEKILVPLDGSELAETAIPYVRDLSSQLGAEVYLLHVCPPEHQVYNHMHQIYLNSVAEGLRKRIKEIFPTAQEIKISGEVISGEPIKVISDYVKQKEISLVVATTCGASGLRRLALGNVADKILRLVGVPTLLIRVSETKATATVAGAVSGAVEQGLIRKILLTLDMSEASKIAVPYAVQLAKKLNASITLFSMAQTVYSQNLDAVGPGVGANWDAIDKSTEQYLDQYLKSVEADIQAAGVQVNHTSYLGIDAGYEILEMEKRTQADLIIMATRGRSPISRWAFGSTAEKVLREGDRPLLLVKKKA